MSYLEVVGVRSEDSYGAQITRTADRSIADLSMASAKKNFRSSPKVPSADGVDRVRLHVAEHLVIAYRDRAEYDEGRGRWRAYQQDVLRAKLDHLTGVRPPIAVDDRPPQSFASDVLAGSARLGRKVTARPWATSTRLTVASLVRWRTSGSKLPCSRQVRRVISSQAIPGWPVVHGSSTRSANRASRASAAMAGIAMPAPPTGSSRCARVP